MLHLSYLADALDSGHPEFFEQHVHWYTGFWPLRELGELRFARLLETLEATLTTHLSAPGAAQEVFAAARLTKEKLS